MITNTPEKIKGRGESSLLNGLFMVFLILLTGSACFGIGRLSALHKEKEPITIEYPPLVSGIGEGTLSQDFEPQGKYVASQSGTKYYAVHCGSVSRIKEENKIYFATEEEAELAGFSKAENCKF